VSKRISIIDGQGGGIGATLIKYLKEAYGESVVLIALGTNLNFETLTIANIS
jgi:hypothetical protein